MPAILCAQRVFPLCLWVNKFAACGVFLFRQNLDKKNRLFLSGLKIQLCENIPYKTTKLFFVEFAVKKSLYFIEHNLGVVALCYEFKLRPLACREHH